MFRVARLAPKPTSGILDQIIYPVTHRKTRELGEEVRHPASNTRKLIDR